MSVDYVNLSQMSLKRTTSNYFQWVGNAQESRKSEIASCVDIQRTWRGYNARKYIAFLDLQATSIKRVWRGYKGRQRVSQRKFEKVVQIENAFYDSCAKVIQKVWRGHASRKNRQDYYSRKKYIDFVTAKALDLNENVDQEIAGYTQYLADEDERKQSREFEKITSSMHHLTSTYTQKGVFNSVYGEQYATTAYGIPLEEHIRESAHNELHARKTMKKQMKRDKKRMDATLEAKEQEDEATLRRSGRLNAY